MTLVQLFTTIANDKNGGVTSVIENKNGTTTLIDPKGHMSIVTTIGRK